jgi:ankyrin repeat protein
MSAEFEALYEAAALGDRATVEKLLRTNPELVHASDETGFTALHGVAGQDDTELAELLIRHGANVSAKNDMQMTPLHIAQCASIVEVLVRHGADVNARADFGWTPLHVQAQEPEETGAFEVIEALLEHGADPNLADEQGNTPLSFATRREEPEKIKILRDHGARR